MTALEKLIKLGLTDASPLYRETAAQAQAELDRADTMLDDMANCALDNMEGVDGDEFKYQEELLCALMDVRNVLGTNKRPSGIGSCTPTDNVAK